MSGQDCHYLKEAACWVRIKCIACLDSEPELTGWDGGHYSVRETIIQMADSK